MEVKPTFLHSLGTTTYISTHPLKGLRAHALLASTPLLVLWNRQVMSPLQSRLAASLAASLFVLALYLLLASPKLALAAELPLDSRQAIDGPHGPGREVQRETLYEPEFGLFEGGIVGRAPQGVIPLPLDQPRALNLQPGTTACYVVEKSALFGTAGSKEPIELYLSANTCQQPRSTARANGAPPPQLILSVSNSTEAGCPKASTPLKGGQDKAFEEGAVTYSVNATGDIYVGVTALNVSAGTQGIYNFEVAASLGQFLHQYNEERTAELLWMDSDSSSALLVTRNLTDEVGEIERIMSQEPPYELFVSNKNWTSMNGMRHSACGLQNSAQIMANSRSNGALNSPVRTTMTLRGPGGLPKQQFYFVALNASTTYTGILVKKARGDVAGKRQDGGGSAGGSTVFAATDFDTVSGGFQPAQA